MAPIPRGGTVAVTGAAGFIGGWVVKTLLDKGYRVRACVRDVDDDAKTGFLKAMGGYASGRLTLWAADLDSPGCFDAAFKGASGNRSGFFSDMYGAGPIRFFQLLEAWRADGQMAGLALS